MNARTPLVSILMPSLDQATFIGAAIESVLSQDYAPIELIVQDGGSEDGTVEILARNSAGDSRIRWRSEPDDGPAQAMNRALERCRGTIIGWLNSDDLYKPGAVRRAVDALDRSASTIMVYGHGDHVDEDGAFLGRYPTLEPTAGIDAFHKGCFICQPTVFFKRTMYSLLGPLHESYRTAFDFEYWLRAFSAFPDRIGFVDAVQAGSRLHDSCITRTQRGAVALEAVTLTRAFLGRSELHWVSTHLEELVSRFAEGDEISRLEDAAISFLNDVAFAFDDGELDSMHGQFRSYLDSRRPVAAGPIPEPE